MFLDDLVDQLKSIFESEDLIGELHCLLHADDALVLTTDRDTFIRKHNMQLWIIFVKTCRHCTCLNLATFAINEVGADKSDIVGAEIPLA